MMSLAIKCLAFTLCALSFAGNDEIAAQTRFFPLTVSEDSVKVVSHNDVGRSTEVEALLEFEIRPATTCQDNYAGLFQTSSVSRFYTVVYAYQEGPCKTAKARKVRAMVSVAFNHDVETIHINGMEFALTFSGDGKTLSVGKK